MLYQHAPVTEALNHITSLLGNICMKENIFNTPCPQSMDKGQQIICRGDAMAQIL